MVRDTLCVASPRRTFTLFSKPFDYSNKSVWEFQPHEQINSGLVSTSLIVFRRDEVLYPERVVKIVNISITPIVLGENPTFMGDYTKLDTVDTELLHVY